MTQRARGANMAPFLSTITVINVYDGMALAGTVSRPLRRQFEAAAMRRLAAALADGALELGRNDHSFVASVRFRLAAFQVTSPAGVCFPVGHPEILSAALVTHARIVNVRGEPLIEDIDIGSPGSAAPVRFWRDAAGRIALDPVVIDLAARQPYGGGF